MTPTNPIRRQRFADGRFRTIEFTVCFVFTECIELSQLMSDDDDYVNYGEDDDDKGDADADADETDRVGMKAYYK